jgi:polyisoprenyl-teichoic acid--peptidoglycan teichoic acid transferase
MIGFRVVVRVLLMAALVALVVPASTVRPTTLSLSRVETAKSVDFESGVVWILVLGSDAKGGETVEQGDTDAIELLGIDFESGAAAAIGIPRDAWVDIPAGVGLDRINAAWPEGNKRPGVGGAELAARTVEDLVGIAPDFVLVTGFEGFRAMTDEFGAVDVRSPVAFTTDGGRPVQKGLNRFDTEEALDFARSRDDLDRSDFDRMANHQALLLGYLRGLRAREDDEGFMEDMAYAAIGGIDTDVAPTDLYRLAQAVTQVDPAKVTGCLVLGSPFTTNGGADVIRADTDLARRLGRDAEPDATLEPGCQG